MARQPNTAPIDPSDFKARYNRLMSEHQQVLDELRALKGQQGTPGADGAGSSGHFDGQQDLSAEMAAHAQAAAAARQQQEAEDQALAEAVAQSRLEKAQKLAAERFPAAVPLLDMVNFDPNDLDGYMVAVEQLSTALGGQGTSEPAPPPAPPVMAGNPPLVQETAADRLDQIKAEARETGNWSAYFRAKEEMAARAAGLIQ